MLWVCMSCRYITKQVQRETVRQAQNKVLIHRTAPYASALQCRKDSTRLVLHYDFVLTNSAVNIVQHQVQWDRLRKSGSATECEL